MAARMMRLGVVALLAMPAAAASLTDPTALPMTQASSGAEGTVEPAGLTWVKINGKNSIAWLGGTAVKLGDPADGGRVTAIREDHVVISGRDGRRTIYLLDQSVRAQPLAQPRPDRKIRK